MIGRTFEGWEEGEITFMPTYKYETVGEFAFSDYPLIPHTRGQIGMTGGRTKKSASQRGVTAFSGRSIKM